MALRIASLLPSTTEIVARLGLADALVGVTHECDFPASAVEGRAIMTSTSMPSPHTLSQEEIHDIVWNSVRKAGFTGLTIVLAPMGPWKESPRNSHPRPNCPSGPLR